MMMGLSLSICKMGIRRATSREFLGRANESVCQSPSLLQSWCLVLFVSFPTSLLLPGAKALPPEALHFPSFILLPQGSAYISSHPPGPCHLSDLANTPLRIHFILFFTWLRCGSSRESWTLVSLLCVPITCPHSSLCIYHCHL